MIIRTQFYINTFNSLLADINNAEDSIKCNNLAIASENSSIIELTEQQSKLKAEIAEIKEKFEEKYIELYDKKSKSIRCLYDHYSINLYLDFFDKTYELFTTTVTIPFHQEPKEIGSSTAAPYIANYFTGIKFNQKVQELCNLYAKYEVNPDYIKSHMLKVYNGIRIQKLKKLIANRNADLMVCESSLSQVEILLTDTILTPTLFNKIFHKKLLMLQEEKNKLKSSIQSLKNEIVNFEHEIEEIEQNPEKNMESLETEIKALSDFLDFYQLIKETQDAVYFKRSYMNQLDENISAKESWICEHNKTIAENNEKIDEAKLKIDNLCDQLSKDKISFKELSKNSNDEVVQKLLEYYNQHIEKSIEQIL